MPLNPLWNIQMTPKPCILQRVQLMLKASEKTDKSDDSPVTIADYGKSLSIHVWHVHASL